MLTGQEELTQTERAVAAVLLAMREGEKATCGAIAAGARVSSRRTRAVLSTWRLAGHVDVESEQVRADHPPRSFYLVTDPGREWLVSMTAAAVDAR